MEVLRSSSPLCSTEKHCSKWAWKYLRYCVCGAKDEVSLFLGFISVLSWGVAEIPQIITNCKQKSTEGLSVAFLLTWIIGDLCNLFGCILEPATLPTQFYMALLFTLTTMILAVQTLYYAHLYPRLKSNRRWCEDHPIEQKRDQDNDVGIKGLTNGINVPASGGSPSSPIPVHIYSHSSPERDLYYTSARSLSMSHTPIAGSLAVPRTPTDKECNSIRDPLLTAGTPPKSAISRSTKSMLCVASFTLCFLQTIHLELAQTSTQHSLHHKRGGVVIQVGRKLLQINEGFAQESSDAASTIGSYLGWVMAAIYIGGRLPQICLNIRRGNVEGLNPLMFIFALVGNTTYVASILVSSSEWSKVRPNLPWLVDAAGCVLLDIFILSQFIYFRYQTRRDEKSNMNCSGNS